MTTSPPSDAPDASGATSLVAALKRLLGESTDSKLPVDHPLDRVVREHMPGADADSQRVVAAVAGLLGCVAYADHEYTEEEERQVLTALGRLHGFEQVQLEAIGTVLRRNLVGIAVGGDHRWVRDVKELTSREQRLELLDALMELAAADDELSLFETNYLRRLSDALGLSQDEYVTVQERYKDKLAVLR